MFKKLKKMTVLQVTALFLAAAFAIVVTACPGDAVAGTEPSTPTVADYDIAGDFTQTEGTTITPIKVEPKLGKSTGAVTVYYTGTGTTTYLKNTDLPQTAGSYAVTFDVAAAPGWNAASGLPAGTLNINNPRLSTPVVGDYDISTNLTQTEGSVTSVTVTAKSDKSTGQVTVYYTGTGSTTYPKSTNVPLVEGTYAVTFDVASATGWNGASNLSAGTLTISGAVEPVFETLSPITQTISNPKNFINGTDSVTWGILANADVLTLGLQPGNDTTEINLNWYSSGAPSGKVAKVRFVKGTFTAGEALIEATGIASAAGSSYTQHKVTVTGLAKGSKYQYAVSSDDENWSEAYDFEIPRAAGTFRFAVIADPQLHNTSWDQYNRYIPDTTGSKTAKGWLDTMEKIVAAGVSFIASGGDQVDTTDNGNETEYTLFYNPPGLRNLPFAPVSGNHDRHTPYNYHYNWPNPQTFPSETTDTEQGRNYFYLYNNILFVVLNTAPYPSSTSAALPNVERFKDTIQAAKAKFPKATSNWDWLIVQHHKSTASVADHLADTDIQYYVEAGFEKVMSDEGVDFVLAGHDHVYARSYPLSGRDNGKVSVPDKTKGNRILKDPGNPIYLTFTTGSGLKYYAVAPDPTFAYANTLYVKENLKYPYLGEITGDDESTQFGSAAYLTKNYLPVSTAAYVQPYIPSYCICEVKGKTITFKTYPIITASGTSPGASAPYSFDANIPYDWVQVTKTN